MEIQRKQYGLQKAKKRLHDQFVLLYERGVRKFYVGGSLGVDQWAGEILLEMQKLPEYKDLCLVVAVPFPGHDATWEEPSRRRLDYLKRHSEVIVVGSEIGTKGYINRNHFLVDHADCLVAVYDNDREVNSVVGQTVHYAERMHISIILIHPDSGKVTYSDILG